VSKEQRQEGRGQGNKAMSNEQRAESKGKRDKGKGDKLSLPTNIFTGVNYGK